MHLSTAMQKQQFPKGMKSRKSVFPDMNDDTLWRLILEWRREAGDQLNKSDAEYRLDMQRFMDTHQDIVGRINAVAEKFSRNTTLMITCTTDSRESRDESRVRLLQPISTTSQEALRRHGILFDMDSEQDDQDKPKE